MGRPIDEDEAINAILREYNKDDSDYPTDYQRGLHAAKKIIEQLPSPQIDASDTDGDMISRKFMHDLGATCIARRDDDGKLIALGRIDMLPSAQPEPRWIPVTEKLPEDEYVIISKKPTKLSGSKWCVNVAIRIADPRSGKIQWRDSGFGIIQDDKVLAWMPRPKPYKENES